MPKWNPRNLTGHYRKRLAEEPGCFEELLGITGRQMTVSQYELRADDAVDHAWGEYEGEGWDGRYREYSEMRAYFVDADLVVAITNRSRTEFVTCFHEHFDRPHGVDPGTGATVGQRQLRYRERLKTDQQGKAIRKLKRIRGV